MNEKTLVIDTNAHVTNIKCHIGDCSDTSTAFISFDNLGCGIITAIKFDATGYNSFGDIVPINGNQHFFLIIQDISIDKNSHANNLKAVLPNGDIRKLVLEEKQICYADGSVATYVGNNLVKVNIREYTSDVKDSERWNALKAKFGEQFIYQPLTIDLGWICGCGRFNPTDQNVCTNCANVRKEIFQATDDIYLPVLLAEYRHNEKIRKDKEHEDAILKQKVAKKRKIVIGIVSVICIALAILIGQVVIMSGRTTFPSEVAMKEALQGKYTYYEDYEASRQIEIDGDQFRYIYRSVDSDNWMDIDWYPNKGKIHTYEDIIVTKDGDLKVDGELYKKGGYMSSGNSYSSSYQTESGYSVLDITVDSVTNNSSYVVCTGSVKNTGTKTYYYVEVKGSFKDSSGNVLDTDWTYAAGSEGLAPNESTTFRLSVPKNTAINSCSVSLLDFD